MTWYRCGSSSGIEYLFGLSDFIDDVYIDANSGNEIPYNGWSATDYISVTPGETLLCSTAQQWRDYNGWYDENKSFISNFTIDNSSAGTYTTITVPNNAKYFRISQSTGFKSTIIIWREWS